VIIATEEAFATSEFLDTYLDFAAARQNEGMLFAASVLSRPGMRDRLTDIDVRLAEMDAHGTDMHLMSLTSPGVQVFDPDLGTALAIRVNNEMAALIRQHPNRLAGLAAIAPQDPRRAAAEIERAMGDLGFNGIIINSHTQGEFLDDRKFWPIFDAAVKHRAPIYLHPTFPPDTMIEPYVRYGLNGAIWGFGAETSLHAVRLVMSGVFDRYPELQIVLGHMGEALPYWFLRLDLQYQKQIARQQHPPGMVKLNRMPSDYFRSNFHFTTSGMYWNDLLEFAIKTMGAERIMFSIDYPYEPSTRSTEWIKQIPVSPQDKDRIMSGNAIKLFQIRSR